MSFQTGPGRVNGGLFPRQRMGEHDGMVERPLVLVTNDDGIEADGLWLLAEALLADADVMIAAPAFQQSGSGTAFTLHRELQAERAHSRLEGVDAWQINGTPGDAVVVGLRRYAPRRVKAIVSGVNPGANLGRDAIHSGTVGAAMQGHHRGMPSVAVSLASIEPQHLADAAAVGARITKTLLDSGEAQFLNVNVPPRPLAELQDVRVTTMALLSVERLLEEIDDQGVIHRRVVYRDDVELPEHTDAWAVRQGYVSVTPIGTDLTAHHALDAVRRLLR